MFVQNENPWLPLCSEPMCSLSMATVFPAQAGALGLGLIEMGKSLAVTLVRICWAGNNAGKDRRCLGTSELVSYPLLSWFVVWFYSPGQAVSMSYSHLSLQNSLSQPLEKPKFKAGCSPGKIPVAAEPEFLLISASRAVPEVCACRKGVTSLQARSHQPLEWSRHEAHGG